MPSTKRSAEEAMLDETKNEENAKNEVWWRRVYDTLIAKEMLGDLHTHLPTGLDFWRRIYDALMGGEMLVDPRTHFTTCVVPLIWYGADQRKKCPVAFDRESSCYECDDLAGQTFQYIYYYERMRFEQNDYRLYEGPHEGRSFDEWVSDFDVPAIDNDFDIHMIFYGEDHIEDHINYARQVDWKETSDTLFAYHMWCDPEIKQGGPRPNGGTPVGESDTLAYECDGYTHHAYRFAVPKRCGVKIVGKTFSDESDETGNAVRGNRRESECPYSLKEMRGFCRENGVRGYSKMRTHRELARALMNV